jgi:hypothetical protein
VSCMVLSKGVKFGVKFNKQRFGALCCVWCCVGAKQRCKARIRCGFPIGKAFL